MSTVYRYYAYPLHTRPRISQVLILPPFQRLGIGAQLVQASPKNMPVYQFRVFNRISILKAIYAHFTSISSVIDITVEDPSEDFQRLRDFVDSQNCENLPAFSEQNLFKG
jgi:histone acetyltransferase 1